MSPVHVARVWDEHSALRDALSYWKADPLDRAVGHVALSIEQPTRREIEERLHAAGIRATPRELDFSLERLELGHVFLRQADARGGQDRWVCPVPLIRRFEERIMTWDEHLERDAEELRRAVVEQTATT